MDKNELKKELWKKMDKELEKKLSRSDSSDDSTITAILEVSHANLSELIRKQTISQVISKIDTKIQTCKSLCFCKGLIKGKGFTSQDTCANCHSKDILVELKKELMK